MFRILSIPGEKHYAFFTPYKANSKYKILSLRMALAPLSKHVAKTVKSRDRKLAVSVNCFANCNMYFVFYFCLINTLPFAKLLAFYFIVES